VRSIAPKTATGTRLKVRVQPRSSRNAIGNMVAGELKIFLTALPVDSAANTSLCRLLAKLLACPQRCISIVRGQTSRHKVLDIANIDPDMVIQRLEID